MSGTTSDKEFYKIFGYVSIFIISLAIIIAILSNVFAHKEQCGNRVIYFNPSNRKQIANAIEKIWVSDLLYSKYKIKSYKMAKKYSLKNFSTNLVNNIIKN